MKTNAGIRTLILCCILGFLAAEAAVAASQRNNLNLANPIASTTQSLSLSYSPTSTAQAAGLVTVNNGTKTADNRAFCVVFKLTNPGSQGTLSFSLINAGTGNTLSLTGSPASVNEVISGSFVSGTKANTNKAFNITFQVFSTTLPAPGTYTAIISESIYGGSTYPASGAVLDTNTLTVTITVGTIYDVSVVPTGSTFSLASSSQALNFGTLAAGQSLGADILVRSNVSYSLSLASAHLGSLVNNADSTSSVGYSLSSNGTTASLNPGPASIANGAVATYASPKRYSLLATILPFSFPSAGTYSDTVTVILASP